MTKRQMPVFLAAPRLAVLIFGEHRGYKRIGGLCRRRRTGGPDDRARGSLAGEPHDGV